MRRILIRNLTRPEVSPVKPLYADSFLAKLRGLTFRRSLGTEDGLLLVQSGEGRLDSSIHMLGVFFDIGIVWINNARQVVDVCLARCWRPAYFPKRPSRYVLEIHPARLADFQVGDEVAFEETPGR
jgi:uncharacterized membrane protein (UPF0127 family)